MGGSGMAWDEAQDGSTFAISFEGIDREGRDARETAAFTSAAHAGAGASGFNFTGGSGPSVSGSSGGQVISVRARIVGTVVLCALLSPIMLAQCVGRGWQAGSTPDQWSNLQWIAHLALTFVGLLAFAAVAMGAPYLLRRSAARPPPSAPSPLTDGRFTLRLTPAELTCAGPPGTTPAPSIAFDRIAGFAGDQRLRVKLADGSVTTLPCVLPAHADHASLAAALDRKLAEVRAARGGYR